MDSHDLPTIMIGAVQYKETRDITRMRGVIRAVGSIYGNCASSVHYQFRPSHDAVHGVYYSLGLSDNGIYHGAIGVQ